MGRIGSRSRTFHTLCPSLLPSLQFSSTDIPTISPLSLVRARKDPLVAASENLEKLKRDEKACAEYLTQLTRRYESDKENLVKSLKDKEDQRTFLLSRDTTSCPSHFHFIVSSFLAQCDSPTSPHPSLVGCFPSACTADLTLSSRRSPLHSISQ